MNYHACLFVALLSGLTATLPSPAYAQYVNSRTASPSVTAPSNEDVARAVLKAVGAYALHEASKPQASDGFAELLVRSIARNGRDELLDSALRDLSPISSKTERSAVRNLAVLALEGRLDHDRDRVLRQLRRQNPDMANAVEIAEFLLQLAHAIDQASK